LISKRYLFCMDEKITDTDEIAEMLVYIGRAARGLDAGSDLTAGQWTALRFFSRANHASRTPSAFASFHATTRGTASQTIKSLMQKGYLVKHDAPDDRRSVRFDLSDAGKAILRDDPLRALSEAIDRLSPDLRGTLRQVLPVLAGQLADIRETVAFGTCGDCRHYSNGGTASYCACVASELSPVDLGRLCINFAAGEGGLLTPKDDAPKSHP
jgi:DNA-binding MarR family transcriptional regulator